MKLLGFSIEDDFVSIRYSGGHLDLHNNFVFRGVSYNAADQSVKLEWIRGSGEWVPPGSPDAVTIAFTGVHLFKVSERDSEIPTSEDTCLDMIGFIWDELVLEMSGCSCTKPAAGCNHFCAIFSGGIGIKVGAASATIYVASSV